MSIDHMFDNMSSIMTVLSFLTFLGILWWTFIRHRNDDFAQAAQLPFADDHVDQRVREGGSEVHHG
jgi:cytochrome c oxidase cbb3-type subunit 4